MNRRGQRRSANITVGFCTRPETVGSGFVTNISPTGAFMETRVPLALLSIVYLEASDSTLLSNSRGRLAATVVRVDNSGVGLEWCEFGAETTEVYAHLADGINDLLDPHQLPLPAIPDALESDSGIGGDVIHQ